MQVAHLLVVRAELSLCQVLLLKRRNTGRGDGTWSCPAGGVELSETPASAAARELREEVGLVTSPHDLEESYREVAGAVTHVFFRVREWSGAPRNLEPDKAEMIGWYSLHEPPTPMLPFVRRALRATCP